jgi:four helix bundle protein
MLRAVSGPYAECNVTSVITPLSGENRRHGVCFAASVAPPQDLKERTAEFALRIVRFCARLTNTWAAQRIGGQLFDAGTSVGANYSAACRARSRREFVSKIGLVLEEADESEFWLKLLKRSGVAAGEELDSLISEAGQLAAIFTASHKTATENLRASRTATVRP